MHAHIFEQDEKVICRSLKAHELSRPTNETMLPIIIEGDGDVSFAFLHDFVLRNRDTIKNLICEHGAVMFRGFAINGGEGFQKIISLIYDNLANEYKGIAPRANVLQKVFTTTEVSSNIILPPHNEMAYAYKRPGIIAFYCDIEPAIYGETPLYNCETIYQSLSEESKRILEKGVQYVRRHPKKYSKFFPKIGTTWTQSFSTNDKNEVEQSLRASHYDFKWGYHDELSIKTYPPAVLTHPVTRKKCVNLLLSNGLSEFRTLSMFKKRYSLFVRLCMELLTTIVVLRGKGISLTKLYDHDGRKLPYQTTKELHKAFWDSSVIFRWKKDDLLIIDNITAAHGRMNFSGSRRILACLADEYVVDDTKE